MTKKIAICWFRQDLRLADNEALYEACRHKNILPIYILDDKNANEFSRGSASRCGLHYSLKSLKLSLDNHLSCYQGDAFAIWGKLIKIFDIEAVYWNRCYEPWRIARDKRIKEMLKMSGIRVISYNGSLLWEPWQIKKADGQPYKVFTPFYRKGCLQSEQPRTPLPTQRGHWKKDDDSLTIDQLNLLPSIRWDTKFESQWQMTELSAHKRLEDFIYRHLPFYAKGRDFPAYSSTSRLSPYLHFGQISPQQIWHALLALGIDENVETFQSELAWREFSYYLLYHQPTLPCENLQHKFDEFPWLSDAQQLLRWQKGYTGIPLVDAGMRELWQTGYMHNRVRMIVASFLVKNLRIHWRDGAKWFWDCLLDADLASNSASWQWVAGCGADAAPYFRVFNPVLQGQKFDNKGEYIRCYVPEIAMLPDKYLFQPWQASDELLKKSGIRLGVNYPEPMVDLKISRQLALKSFKVLS